MIRQVAIQGAEGSFHEIAARRCFSNEEVSFLYCMSFPELFARVASDSGITGFVAIENSIAGTILPNLSLIRDYGLHITGEYRMRIRLDLFAIEGVSISDLREVHSHPVALLQCRSFFDNYPHIKLTETPDTAASAYDLVRSGSKDRGVVASSMAGALSRLEALARGIETGSRSYTRFLVLSGDSSNAIGNPAIWDGSWKAVIFFTLAHHCGALSRFLSLLADRGFNLTMIQSIPLPGREWEYMFWCEMVFSCRKSFYSTLEEAGNMCSQISVAGIFPESSDPGELSSNGGNHEKTT